MGSDEEGRTSGMAVCGNRFDRHKLAGGDIVDVFDAACRRQGDVLLGNGRPVRHSAEQAAGAGMLSALLMILAMAVLAANDRLVAVQLGKDALGGKVLRLGRGNGRGGKGGHHQRR